MKEHDPNAGSWQSDIKSRVERAPVTSGETLENVFDRIHRMVEEAKEFRGRVELEAAKQPQTKPCEKHPHVILPVNIDRSIRASTREEQRIGEEVILIRYDRCHECDKDATVAQNSTWMTAAGVPALLMHGSFKTFRVESEEDRDNIDWCRRFVLKGRGFLILTGTLGDGKSLLAVATMREFGAGRFITQNDLLTELRRGYRDPRAEDIIRSCQRARCLVIDDFGLSVGGADELPMLQSIFDHRHGEKKPTIITSNLTLDDVRDVMGARLADRMNQSTFRVLKFTGKSSRAAERNDYFAD